MEVHIFLTHIEIFKNKKIGETYLPFYITSHWIALVLKILTLSKYNF